MALDMTVELRSLAQLAHRLATLSGTCSVALLWATNWFDSKPKGTSIPVVQIGVATSVLAVLSAVVAVGLEVLSRLRVVEREPELSPLEQHRRRIEAESAAFRETLPSGPQLDLRSTAPTERPRWTSPDRRRRGWRTASPRVHPA